MQDYSLKQFEKQTISVMPSRNPAVNNSAKNVVAQMRIKAGARFVFPQEEGFSPQSADGNP